MKTWRNIWLEEGKYYRVVKEHKDSLGDFKLCEKIEFVGTAYSPYDSSTLLLFKRGTESELVSFEIHDDDEDLSREYFVQE